MDAVDDVRSAILATASAWRRYPWSTAGFSWTSALFLLKYPQRNRPGQNAIPQSWNQVLLSAVQNREMWFYSSCLHLMRHEAVFVSLHAFNRTPVPAPGCARDTRSQPCGKGRSEEHTSELQSRENHVCRL